MNAGIVLPGYSQLMSADHPGLILILLDQSGSMKDDGKAEFAAQAVNRTVREVIHKCTRGEDIRDFCWVGIIGYGRTIRPIVGGMISELSSKADRELVYIDDGMGGRLEMEMLSWVKPTGDGGTPMAEALGEAYSLVAKWLEDPRNNHRDSFPPVVINITDGEPNDFDGVAAPGTKDAADRLRTSLGTSDGKVLLLNAHITGGSRSREVALPHTTSDLGGDATAVLLYEMSSELHPNLIRQAQEAGFSPQPGARGMVFNAGAETLVRLLMFGSTVRTAPLR